MAQYITLADGTKIEVPRTGDVDSGYDFDFQGALNNAGYVSLPGACAGISFFVGREHSQREKAISRQVQELKWYAGFTGWNRDNYLDVAIPAILCGLILIL